MSILVPASDQQSDRLPIFLTTIETARYLSIPVQEMERMRLDGRGPRYYRVGEPGRAKVVYLQHDVEAWMDRHQPELNHEPHDEQLSMRSDMVPAIGGC